MLTAELVLAAVPRAALVDVAELEHPVREPWPNDSLSLRGLRAAADGPARALARVCVHRSYPVEQELTTLAAVERALALPHGIETLGT